MTRIAISPRLAMRILLNMRAPCRRSLEYSNRAARATAPGREERKRFGRRQRFCPAAPQPCLPPCRYPWGDRKGLLTGLRPGISSSLSAGPVSFVRYTDSPHPREGPRRPGTFPLAAHRPPGRVNVHLAAAPLCATLALRPRGRSLCRALPRSPWRSSTTTPICATSSCGHFAGSYAVAVNLGDPGTLKVLRERPPAAIILDLDLATFDAFELLRLVSSDAQLRGVPDRRAQLERRFRHLRAAPIDSAPRSSSPSPSLPTSSAPRSTTWSSGRKQRSAGRLKLGALLVASGLVTQAQLDGALKRQRSDGGRLGESARRRGPRDRAGHRHGGRRPDAHRRGRSRRRRRRRPTPSVCCRAISSSATASCR